ncbi:MAG: NAD(P)-dependent oxidoreductase [Candidatus Omnitrophica bacterium]|nr:NAD(P)-dependent oxidoreductase [Candidatus Omnitrophota bacterium]
MKILVTGANGFIGRRCVTFLVAGGHEVDALDLADAGLFKGCGVHRFHVCDIALPFTLPGTFDAVVHLAAYNVTHVGDTDASIYARVNVDGTANVLSGVNARRVVFLSTTKVYAQNDRVITESCPLDPQADYEKSKRQAEELCRRECQDRELVILRSVNVFGPGQPPKAVIPVFVARAMRGEPINVFAPRGSWLQFVHVDDLVQALGLAVSVPGAHGVFNVASAPSVRLDDLAGMIKAVCRSGSELCFRDERIMPECRVSFEAITKAWGWLPLVTIEEGVRQYYENYVNHQQA